MAKMRFAWLRFAIALVWIATALQAHTPVAAAPAATTYYVSSALGSDANNGLSESAPFASIARVNALALMPGDRVLLRCGDIWRVDPLILTRSGLAGQPITVGAYPAGCSNPPLLSGTQPVGGWTAHSANIYRADLAAGANAGKFGYGVNQLFRSGQRLPMGRWPNLDAADGGYSTIEAQPAGSQFTDNELPAGNWSGAVAHIRGMRWYILNRRVSAVSGKTLSVGAALDCWGGCAGWGYFLNNHLNTLDQEGEWYYDSAAQRLYLYTTAGAPADGQVEGSVILHDDSRSWGAVQLGEDSGDAIAYVTVDNLAIRGWFRHGIATPTNLHPTENHDVILSNNRIADVDGVGINLATWVWGAQDGRPDGWRGGYNLTVAGNTIERANHIGIDSYARSSLFSGNVIRDVGRIGNLGAAGMGCALDAGEGACTEDGDGIRIKVDRADDSGNFNVLVENRLERIGYNGMDVFGHNNRFTRNVIRQACISKADCGGVRTFGRTSLAQSPVYNLLFDGNLIIDTLGVTDGCRSDFDSRFGFGLYIDNYSRDVALSDNAVINSSATGILFQRSTGSLSGNTLYNNGHAYNWAAQVWVGAAPAAVGGHHNNVLYSLNPNGWTLSLESPGVFGASDQNYFFHPYRAANIRAAGDKTLAGWRAYSGKDGASKEAWFSLPPGATTNSQVFVNDSAQAVLIDLGGRLYYDLDHQAVLGSLSLPAYTAKILIDGGLAPLSLASLSPALSDVDAPADFTLRVFGAGFTANSVVRWMGAERPTTFVNSGELRAAVAAGDVDAPGLYAVRVYDPSPAPGGTLTAPLYFAVVEEVYRVWMPVVVR